MNILIFCIVIVHVCKAFIPLKIQPEEVIHVKGQSLIATCNATSIKKVPILIYHYNNNNFTVPSIYENDKYVYIGNLTITNPNQFKVNLLCLQNGTDDLLSAKIYYFGYSPEMVLHGDSTPKLSCQDFNLRRVICCMKPSQNEIVQLTRLIDIDNQSHQLKIELYNLESEEQEVQFNNSCFNLSTVVFIRNLYLNLTISNVLGKKSFTFSFDRFQLMKPEAPSVKLTAVDKSKMKLEISLYDDGEFLISGVCSSFYPRKIQKNISISVIRKLNTEDFDGWIPYSKVICELKSKIMFGEDTQGQFSESGTSNVLQMPESKPNNGPFVSSAFMNYDLLSKNNYLHNIRLYFLDLDPFDQNGIITYYKWKCSDCFHQTEKLSNIVNNNSRRIQIYKAKANSSFMITACTKVGCSDSWRNMSFLIHPRVHVKSRIFLNHYDNNIDLLCYDENFTKSEFHTAIDKQFYILICYSTNNDKNCSSIQLVEINKNLNGRKSLRIQGNKTPVKFAFIPSLNDSNSINLNWWTCVYKTVSNDDIKRMMPTIQNNDYITHKLESTLLNSIAKLIIIIPPCELVNFVIITGIHITYDSTNGIKYITHNFLPQDKIEIVLSDLKKYHTNNIEIFIINSNGFMALWNIYPIKTEWIAIDKLILLISGVFVFVAVTAYGIILWIKKYFEKYFKQTYKPSLQQRISTYNNVEVSLK